MSNSTPQSMDRLAIIQDLKNYLEPIFENIKTELDRAYQGQLEVSRLVRSIETQNNTAIQELRNEMQVLKQDSLEHREDIAEMRTKLEEVQRNQSDQKVVNDRQIRLEKILWTILVLVLGMVLAIARDLLLYGGIQGLTK